MWLQACRSGWIPTRLQRSSVRSFRSLRRPEPPDHSLEAGDSLAQLVHQDNELVVQLAEPVEIRPGHGELDMLEGRRRVYGGRGVDALAVTQYYMTTHRKPQPVFSPSLGVKGPQGGLCVDNSGC